MLTELINQLGRSDREQKIKAIETLGQLGEPKALGSLVRTLQKHEDDPEIKEVICDALGDLGDLRAVSPLISHLRDEDEDVRAAAFSALYNIGHKQANSLPDQLDWESGFADPTAELTQVAWQIDFEAIKILQNSLNDKDFEVRIGAIYTLGQLGVMNSLESVAQLLYQDPHHEVRSAAAYALGQFGLKGASDFVLQALQWTWNQNPAHPEIRNSIIRALNELERSDAGPTFLQALQDPDEIIRQLAVMGIGRLRWSEGLDAVCQTLSDPVTDVRRNAAYALSYLADPRSIQSLVYATANQSSEVRNAIIYTLKKFPKEVVLNEIQKALTSDNEEIRSGCAYLLGSIPHEQLLTHALQDPVPKVRKSAALSIGNGQMLVMQNSLKTALSDEHWTVRTAAVEGLRRLGDPQVLPTLYQHQTDSHPVVQNAIKMAIQTLEK